MGSVSYEFSTSTSLKLFRRICLSRNFELNLKKAYDAGLTPRSHYGNPSPIYLSLGQETATAAVSLAFPGAKQFGQHRNHDLYLCYGGSPEKLRDELLGLPTGCAKGMGGCASIHSPETGMFGHDGLMGSQVPIAVGYALGSGNKTLTTMGDASAEEGYVLGAMGEAATKKAPILFVCMDNNLSILTKKEVRRNWKMVNEAKAKGMPAFDIIDDPWVVMEKIHWLKNDLPAFINIRYCRELWHAGTGCDGPPEWNRYELVKAEMIKLGLGPETEKIESESAKYMEYIWKDAIDTKKAAL
jgi:TPP-dependent pyruvate/acetoin dehydrogenase alpha subunit